MSSFTFSLADATFREWLYEGLKEHSSPQTDGTPGTMSLVADTRAFQADVRDGHFNGLDLSTNQVNYLVSLFKGQTIVFDSFGNIHSPTNQEHSPPSSRVNELVDGFFSACRLNPVSPAGDFWGEAKNYVAERVLDTGTEEARLERLLRSVLDAGEMHELRRLVSLDFRSGGKSFDEILFSELSGRERGRMLGIVRTKERGTNYYLEKAYGPMGKQIMTRDRREKVAVQVLGEVEREISQKELHYGMGNDLQEEATEFFRQKQDLRPLEEAKSKLKKAYDVIVDMNAPGKGKADKLNRALIDVEMELDIYRSAEKEGLSQVEGSYVAAEEGTYTVVGASVALLTGMAAAPAIGATAAVLAGGVGGTLAETALRAEGLISKNNFNGQALTQALHASATNSFATSVGLGFGMASGRLVSPVLRQVVVNEAMGGAHAVLRADETYGIDEVLIMGASGFVGGKVEATAWGANKLTNLAFEASREAGENLAEAQFGDEGNVTTEVVIGSVAGALTELGGSKLFVGGRHQGSLPSTVLAGLFNRLIADESGSFDPSMRTLRAFQTILVTARECGLNNAQHNRLFTLLKFPSDLKGTDYMRASIFCDALREAKAYGLNGNQIAALIEKVLSHAGSTAIMTLALGELQTTIEYISSRMTPAEIAEFLGQVAEIVKEWTPIAYEEIPNMLKCGLNASQIIEILKILREKYDGSLIINGFAEALEDMTNPMDRTGTPADMVKFFERTYPQFFEELGIRRNNTPPQGGGSSDEDYEADVDEALVDESGSPGDGSISLTQYPERVVQVAREAGMTDADIGRIFQRIKAQAEIRFANIQREREVDRERGIERVGHGPPPRDIESFISGSFAILTSTLTGIRQEQLKDQQVARPFLGKLEGQQIAKLLGQITDHCGVGMIDALANLSHALTVGRDAGIGRKMYMEFLGEVTETLGPATAAGYSTLKDLLEYYINTTCDPRRTTIIDIFRRIRATFGDNSSFVVESLGAVLEAMEGTGLTFDEGVGILERFGEKIDRGDVTLLLCEFLMAAKGVSLKRGEILKILNKITNEVNRGGLTYTVMQATDVLNTLKGWPLQPLEIAYLLSGLIERTGHQAGKALAGFRLKLAIYSGPETIEIARGLAYSIVDQLENAKSVDGGGHGNEDGEIDESPPDEAPVDDDWRSLHSAESALKEFMSDDFAMLLNSDDPEIRKGQLEKFVKAFPDLSVTQCISLVDSLVDYYSSRYGYSRDRSQEEFGKVVTLIVKSLPRKEQERILGRLMFIAYY